MNREVVEKWVEALRSGEHTQCTNGSFSNPTNYSTQYESFCCLGLLNHINNYLPYNTKFIDEVIPELHDDRDELPSARTGPQFETKQTNLWCHLTAMNDGDGLYERDQRNFNQIADFIEEKLLK